jgi:hypothetical protein
MKYLILIFTGLFLLIFPTLSVGAEPNVQMINMHKPVVCGQPGHILVKNLHTKYQENIAAVALGSVEDKGTLSQVFLLWNDSTKTYTFGELLPNGIFCILASGEKMEFTGKFEPVEKSKPITPDTQEANPEKEKATPMSHSILYSSVNNSLK